MDANYPCCTLVGYTTKTFKQLTSSTISSLYVITFNLHILSLHAVSCHRSRSLTPCTIQDLSILKQPNKGALKSSHTVIPLVLQITNHPGKNTHIHSKLPTHPGKGKLPTSRATYPHIQGNQPTQSSVG